MSDDNVLGAKRNSEVDVELEAELAAIREAERQWLDPQKKSITEEAAEWGERLRHDEGFAAEVRRWNELVISGQLPPPDSLEDVFRKTDER